MLANPTRNNARVLFFGRADCSGTKAIHRKLKSLGFKVTYIESKSRGEKLSPETLSWTGEYILSFRSLFILPKSLIQRAFVAAINFHPAPPEYPGSGCTNYALYDMAQVYGVTAHIINEKVDNGTILEVRRFNINPTDNLKSVLKRTHEQLLVLCLDFIGSIHLLGKKFIEEKISTSKHERWNGQAKLIGQLDTLKTVPLDVSKEELERIIRATYLEEFPPKIKLHGFNFYLRLDE